MKHQLQLQLVFIIVFCVINVNAQITIDINDTATTSHQIDAPFFINDVRVTLQLKSEIGIYKQGNTVTGIQLKEGTRKSLIQYCNRIQTNKPNQKEVSLDISNLELLVNADSNKVSIQSEIYFTIPNDSGYFILIKSNHRLDTNFIFFPKDLANSLTAIINTSIEELSVYFSKNNNTINTTNLRFIRNSKKSVSGYNKHGFRQEFIFIAGGNSGVSSEGPSLSFIHFKDFVDEKWLHCGKYSYQQYEQILSNSRGSYIGEKKIYHLRVGLQHMYKLSNYFWVYFPTQFVIGREEYHYPAVVSLVIGGYIGEGICFMSKSRVGFYAGIHGYQFFSTSNTFDQDYGGCLELGFKF